MMSYLLTEGLRGKNFTDSTDISSSDRGRSAGIHCTRWCVVALSVLLEVWVTGWVAAAGILAGVREGVGLVLVMAGSWRGDWGEEMGD